MTNKTIHILFGVQKQIKQCKGCKETKTRTLVRFSELQTNNPSYNGRIEFQVGQSVTCGSLEVVKLAHALEKMAVFTGKISTNKKHIAQLLDAKPIVGLVLLDSNHMLGVLQ